MSNAVPHFTPEWLEAYNARLRKISIEDMKTMFPPDPPPAPVDKAEREGTPRAPARTRKAADGSFTPYAAMAVAVPSRGYDGKQTKTEERYNRSVLGGTGRFEAVCLYLPGGGRYTPDFMTVDDGVVTFHEVKGSYRLGSQGRAHTAFQEAAAAFPMWRFVWATERKGGGFDVKRFNSQAIDERNS